MTGTGRIRCDLHEDWLGDPYLEDVRFRLKTLEPDNIKKLLGLVGAEKSSIKNDNDSKVFVYDGEDVIDTIEKARIKSGVDEEFWDVESHEFKTYTVTMKLKRSEDRNGKTVTWHEPIQKTNYYCRIKFKKKEVDWEKIIKGLINHLSDAPILPKADGSDVGVICTSDYHIGAEVKNLPVTSDFNVAILRGMLIEAADKINAKKFREVHLMIAGDLIESMTGMNHPNTWKSLGPGMYGERLIIIAFELLKNDFITRINNLKSINMVSGNHDRATVKSDIDNEGAVCGLLAYMLGLVFTDLEINHDHLVIRKEIDGIMYVMMHGHHKMSKQSIEKILFRYGDNTKYNVYVEGHWHARKVGRGSEIVYKDGDVVSMDELQHRKITAPPLFTGNLYSESIGYTSTPGVLIIHNNGRDKIDVVDHCLG